MIMPSRVRLHLFRTGLSAVAIAACLALPAFAQGQAPAALPPAPLTAEPPVPFHPDVRRGNDPGITNPVVVKSATPRYKIDALRRKIAGKVVLLVLIDTQGAVTDARVIRSLDARYGLDEEALKTARLLTFTPARDGSDAAIPIVVQLEVDFTIYR